MRLLLIIGCCCLCAGCLSMRCLRIPVSSKVSKEALETCKTAVTESLDRRDVFRRYAQLLRARGDYNGIRAITARVLEQDSTRTDALYFRAFAQRKLGMTREALTSYRLYSAGNYKDPDPYFGIALCYETLGDNAGAIDAYQQYLLRERRADRDSWQQRAKKRLAAMGAAPLPEGTRPTPTNRPASMPATTATTAKTISSGNAAAATAKAKPIAGCDKHHEAVRADPFATSAYQKLAECEHQAGRHDEVIKRMRMAIRDNPKWARGWYYLGRAQKALGQAASAKPALAKACDAGVSEACQ